MNIQEILASEEYRNYVVELISKHNSLTQHSANVIGKTDFGTFYFSNLFEAQLWIEEFLGQISDGKYENHPKNMGRKRYRGVYKPEYGRRIDYSHVAYKFWTGLQVRIADTTHLDTSIPDWANIHLRFTDLLWLFSKEEASASNKFDVRFLGSEMEKRKLREYILKIERAIRAARKGR